MKTGIIIGSSCDLPRPYIERHALHVLPNNLRFGYELLTETRDPDATLALYRKYLTDKGADADTQPSTEEDIRALILDSLVLSYDRVLVITIARAFSELFVNATKASFSILRDYRHKRRQAGMNGSFALKVLDSKTLFTGEAVLVYTALRRLAEEAISFSQLRAELDALSENIYCYVVPDDLYYLRKRASQRGERSIGLLTYHIGGVLDIKPILVCHRGETQPIYKGRGFDAALVKLFGLARAVLERGLLSDVITMSYAGDPQIIRRKKAFRDLERCATARGVEILLSVMSSSAGFYVGPGAFSLAYAAR